MAVFGGRREAPRRWLPPRVPAETAADRLARHAVDRRRLARLDDRRLADVGLSREAVARRLPFKDAPSAPRRRHRA
ncbi:hypothetical protein DFH01_17145 [Falsiroseomonas bella]|uniref:YjiS-like domain-containing protein n=2 Tax=Falsiroseomonas bella TaxID=2184016 RepID=A0A317FCV9_9PROT|nr:hypothetical protein DFH01_17145 [Falsiroseomonas bella]